MEKLIYWIKHRLFYKEDCKSFCPTCEFYKLCKEDTAYDVMDS